MKTSVKYLFLLGILTGGLSACEPEIETPEPSAGAELNLSNYIAIGNSLTAGYASNGLFLEGQKAAYPELIAMQMRQAGGGAFVTPFFPEDQRDGTGYLRLDGFVAGAASPTPILTQVPRSPAVLAGKSPFAYNATLNPDSAVLKPFGGDKINNWGVPGIRVADIETAGYGYPNAYFGRMLTEAEKPGTSYAAKILAQNPSFFTCWLGNNDVLGYSTAGGYVDLGRTTDPQLFRNNYTGFIDKLVNGPGKPKGVVANIPDVTSIPFFTTVTPGVKTALSAAGAPAFFEFKFDSAFVNVVTPAILDVTGQTKILDSLKVKPWPVSRMGSLNPVTGTIDGDVFLTLTFSPYAGMLGKPGGKAWVDIVKTLVKTFGNLQAFAGIPKPALEAGVWAVSGLDTTKPFGLHWKNPLPDVFVLNAMETARAREATAAFNETIKSVAESRGLAFVDANAYLKKVTATAYYDGIATRSSFLSGGAFSLDGVHLTPRGNALAANEFIKAINQKYKSRIMVLNPGQYRGVVFP